METLERFLAEYPFLREFDSKHHELLVGCASNVRFDPGQFIFKEGQRSDSFYLIRHGKVSIEVFVPGRGPVSIDTVSAGEVLGISWLIEPYHRYFDARALELTRAIALDGACFRKKCEENHDLGYAVMKKFTQILSARLQATRLQIMDIYGSHA